MALPDFDCSHDPIVCCTHLFDIGDQLKDLAVAAVNNPDCYSDVCSAPNVDGIVTIGTGYGYQSDLVVVSMLSFGPSTRSSDVRQNTKSVVTWRSNWQVQLIESGWQTFEREGDDIEFPDPGVLTALAKHSYSHAEQMYRRVGNAVLRRQIGSCGGTDCWVHVGDLTPVDPAGLTVGWRFQVGIGVDMNRSCDES